MKTQEKNNSQRIKEKLKRYWDGVPAVVRKSPLEDSLYNFLFKSFFGHVFGIFLICGVIFLLNFFGLTPKIKDHAMKVKDIAFNLSGPQNRDGGTKINEQNIVSDKKVVNEAKSFSKPQPNSNVKKSKSTEIPDFEIPIPDFKSMTSGINSSGALKKHVSGSEVSTKSISEGVGASSSEGSSAGTGGFNKVATKNLIAVYDISPYVNELKREIRWNWKIPANAENKKAELFLRIARDGKLMILNVKKTSETAEVDNAALNAVRKCLPLNPLPEKYNKGYLDLIFSFDSALNSIGSRY